MRHYGQWCRPCLPLGRLPSLYKVRIIRRHDPNPKSPYPSETPDRPLSRLAGLGFEAQPGRPGDRCRLRGLPRCRCPGEVLRQALDHPGQGVCPAAGAVHWSETEQERLPYRTRRARLPARKCGQRPGAAAVNGNTVDLNTRGFQFYEGMEPAQFVRVRFSGDYVAGLSAANGKALDVVRLEPLMIGGIYPKTSKTAS